MQAVLHGRGHASRTDARKQRGSSVRLLLLALCIGITLQHLGPVPVRAVLSGLKLQAIGDAFLLGCALIAAVVIHEAGHLFVALVLNFAVTGASLGPVRIGYLHKMWSVRLSMKRLLSASISAVPREMENWRAKVLAVIAGGPLATLLSGMIAGALFLSSPGGSARACFLAAVAQLSLYIFALGLIPNERRAGVRNDARLFLTILRNTPDAEEIYLYNCIQQQLLAGVRPGHLPQPLIDLLVCAKARPEFSFLFAHTVADWASDRGDLTAAEFWHREACIRSRECDEKTRSLAFAHLASFLLVFRDDREGASMAARQIELSLISPSWLALRVSAVKALCEGRMEEVRRVIEQAGGLLASELPYYRFERTLLANLRAKIA